MQTSAKLFAVKTPTFMQNEHQKPVFAALKELEAFVGGIQNAEDATAFCQQAVKLFQACEEQAKAKNALANLSSGRQAKA